MRKFENNDTTLNLRVNPTVKQQAEDVLKQLGIPMATAIDMYLRTGGIPFSLSLPKAPAALNTDTMTDDQLHAALSDMEQIYSYIADRHGGILLCRAVRKGRTRHDGECSEGQVQRRHRSHRLQGGRGEVLSNRPAESSICGRSVPEIRRWYISHKKRIFAM